MKKITLKNNKILIIENGLYLYLKHYFINDIAKEEETEETTKTSFLIISDSEKTNNIFIIDENEKYFKYSQLLSYKIFKMYNYKITIKRNAHFSNSDFKIIQKHPEHKAIYYYYLFNIEI